MTANAAAVKLPIVWTDNIAAWFVQVEAQFGLRGVSQDQTKYWHVVAALDSATATRAAFVLEDPPADGKYEAVKDFLVSTFGLSQQQRAQRMLAISDLGDRQPSELMDVMLRLHGSHDRQCYLLREIFLRALPSSVRQGLANSTVKDLRDLAALADGVLASCSPTCLAAVAGPEVNPVTSRRGQRQKDTPTPNDDWCYFHRRFGAEARRCRSPCSWRQGNDQASPRQ